MNRTFVLSASAFVFLASFGVSGPAAAQRVSKIAARQLAAICTNPKGTAICDAYIAGIGDALAGAKHYEAQGGGGDSGATCIPSDVSTATLRSTVVDYLRAHRDLLGKPAAVPTVNALHDAYPCKTP